MQLAEMPALLELISCTNAPKMDQLSESDLYVVFWVEEQNKPVCPRRYFPYRLNSHSPIWDQKRVLRYWSPAGCAELVMQVVDFDDGLTTQIFGHDIVGTVRVPLSELHAAKGSIMTRIVPLTTKAAPTARKEDCVLSFRVHDGDACKSWPVEKWIFLVRHGESKWNIAQEKHDIISMAKSVDHSLSCKGLDQASSLAGKVLAARDQITLNAARGWEGQRGDAPSWVYDRFFAADVIIASPLTRAIETAVVTMQHHPLVSRLPIRLRSEIREIKNAGGLDTIGQFQGDAILPHLKKELADLYKEATETEGHSMLELEQACLEQKQSDGEGDSATRALARVNSIRVDTNNTNDEWWNCIKEDESDARERIAEFLVEMKLSPCENIIAVGHSHFIRHLCRHFLAPQCHEAYPQESTLLGKHTISNCGVLAVKADFSLPVDKCITDLYLMFGSELPATHQLNECKSTGSI
jgi:broad specificity phosphatase PhoE